MQTISISLTPSLLDALDRETERCSAKEDRHVPRSETIRKILAGALAGPVVKPVAKSSDLLNQEAGQ